MNVSDWVKPSLGAVATGLLLAGCVTHPQPPRHPGPYNNPVDAFDAVSEPHPYTGPTGADSDQLNTDLHHLQDAHAAYVHDQQIQAAELRRQQARCRKKAGSHQVRIQDGTDDPNAIYCQSGSDSSDSGDGS